VTQQKGRATLQRSGGGISHSEAKAQRPTI